MTASAAKRRRRGKSQPPHRRGPDLAKPLFLLQPGDLELAARLVRDRLQSIYRKQSVGAYVFVDMGWNCYVLPEQHAAVPVWIREHATWLVGCYSAALRANNGQLREDLEIGLQLGRLLEDLTQHLYELTRP